MDPVKFLDLFIGLPDGGQAGGLSGHNVHADTEISTQLGHARAHKLHNFIFHIAFGKDCADNGQSHILRTDTLCRLAGQIDGNHAGHIDIVGLTEQLLYQLRSALAHGHGSQRAVTGMGIRAQNHLSALCQHLTGKLVDNCLMRGHINSTVLFRTGQTKHVVILVDGSAHGTKAVMTVGQHIGDREFLQP